MYDAFLFFCIYIYKMCVFYVYKMVLMKKIQNYWKMQSQLSFYNYFVFFIFKEASNTKTPNQSMKDFLKEAKLWAEQVSSLDNANKNKHT